MAPLNTIFPPNTPLTTISFRIEKSEVKRFHRLAKRHRVSLAELTRRALDAYAAAQHD